MIVAVLVGLLALASASPTAIKDFKDTKFIREGPPSNPDRNNEPDQSKPTDSKDNFSGFFAVKPTYFYPAQPFSSQAFPYYFGYAPQQQYSYQPQYFSQPSYPQYQQYQYYPQQQPQYFSQPQYFTPATPFFYNYYQQSYKPEYFSNKPEYFSKPEYFNKPEYFSKPENYKQEYNQEFSKFPEQQFTGQYRPTYFFQQQQPQQFGFYPQQQGYSFQQFGSPYYPAGFYGNYPAGYFEQKQPYYFFNQPTTSAGTYFPSGNDQYRPVYPSQGFEQGGIRQEWSQEGSHLPWSTTDLHGHGQFVTAQRCGNYICRPSETCLRVSGRPRCVPNDSRRFFYRDFYYD